MKLVRKTRSIEKPRHEIFNGILCRENESLFLTVDRGVVDQVYFLVNNQVMFNVLQQLRTKLKAGL